MQLVLVQVHTCSVSTMTNEMAQRSTAKVYLFMFVVGNGDFGTNTDTISCWTLSGDILRKLRLNSNNNYVVICTAVDKILIVVPVFFRCF